MNSDNTIVQINDKIQKFQDRVTTGLALATCVLNAEYRKQWNVDQNDFVVLTMNGQLINDSIYTTGLFRPNFVKDKYSVLIKHAETYYEEPISYCKGKYGHLEGRCCIIDQLGNEKVELDQFQTPYIVHDSCIYSVDNNYYNIETGELYCAANGSMSSNEFLFLWNRFGKDKSRLGVMKIEKSTGKYEIFPE